MFKRWAVIGALAFASCTSAWGSLQNWGITFGVTDSIGDLTVGTYTGASNGYDLEDALLPDAPFTGFGYIASYHQNNSQWSGQSGWYQVDTQAPVSRTRQTAWSSIYAWHDLDSPLSSFALTWSIDDPLLNPPITSGGYNYVYNLFLTSVPAGVNYTGARQWNLDPSQTGGTLGNFPVYKTANGLNGYRFKLVAGVELGWTGTPVPGGRVTSTNVLSLQPIPEPASLLMVSSALLFVRRSAHPSKRSGKNR